MREQPPGWRRVRIGDVASERSERSSGLAEVFSITKYAGFVRSLDYFDRQVFSRDTRNYKVVRRNDLAYATIHLDEGSVGVFDAADRGLISPMYTVFEVDPAQVVPQYLHLVMKQDWMLWQYKRIADGSVHRRRSVAFPNLANISIPLPPLREQNSILAGLDSIDAAIEKTAAVIEATERLRTALLRELLTRGIPGRHTEWKHVRGIGAVPACWGVERLSDLGPIGIAAVLTGPFGSQLPATDYVASGVPLLTIGSVQPHGVDAQRLLFISPGTADRLSRYRVRTGDILFSRVATLGRVARVTEEYDGALMSYNLIRLRLDPRRVLPDLVLELIDTLPAVRQSILGVSSSGARQVTNTTSLGNLRLPVPPLEEQRELTRLAASFRARRRADERIAGLLQITKAAAAKALLSGCVRVHRLSDGLAD